MSKFQHFYRTYLSWDLRDPIARRGQRGFLQWLPLLLTTLMNLSSRQSAQATMEEEPVTEEQAVGDAIQTFANRGITIGRDSPVVREAIRRRSLLSRQRKAQQVLAGPDPLSLLFNVFRSN